MENEGDEAPSGGGFGGSGGLHDSPLRSPSPSLPELEQYSMPEAGETLTGGRDEVEAGFSRCGDSELGMGSGRAQFVEGLGEGTVLSVLESEEVDGGGGESAELAAVEAGEGGENVVGVISGEEGRSEKLGTEVGVELEVAENEEEGTRERIVEGGETKEEEEAVEVREVCSTEVGDDTGVPSSGGYMELDGSSLHVSDEVADTSAGNSVMDAEVGDENAEEKEDFEAAENTKVTDPAEVGEDGPGGATEVGNDSMEDTEVFKAVDNTEVTEVGEDADDREVLETVHDTKVAEVGEEADEMAEEGDENAEDIEVLKAVRDTEVAEVGDDNGEDREVFRADHDTEVSEVREEPDEMTVVGEDNAEDREVFGAADDTEVAEVGEEANEMVEEGDDNAEDREVFGAVHDTEVVEVEEDPDEMAEEGDDNAEDRDVLGAVHDTEVVEVEEDPDEMAEEGDDNAEDRDVLGAVHDTEVVEVEEDPDEMAEEGDDNAEDRDVLGAVHDTEVVEVEEDPDEMDEEGDDNAEDRDVFGAVHDTEVVEVEEDPDEMAEEGDDNAEDRDVLGAVHDTEVVEVEEDPDEMGEEGDGNAEDRDVLGSVHDTEVVEVEEDPDEMAELGDDNEEDREMFGAAHHDTEVAEVGEDADAGDTNDEMADELEESEAADTADVEPEIEEATKSEGKRKRGKVSMAAAKVPSKKKNEEDVCFICFDGGELVVCDRRGCPKAYHPACVNHDEAFFQGKGRWNCGCHLCSNCEKNAHYMCFTCTFSLCKGCIKDAVILCVRGNKGFCEPCLKTVTMMEQKQQEDQEMAQVSFDDKSSWEYLFKDYWTGLKERLNLTLDEIARAKNPWKGSHVQAGKREEPDELYDANDDDGSSSDSSGNAEANLPQNRKPKKRLKSRAKATESPSKATAVRTARAKADSFEWASNDLLEFVMHMKNGDRSVLSQFDVQALLLQYIKSNKLRDPRRKSQIICDQRLVNLFGKQRVGHFEMLKLLESHFHVKEDLPTDDLQGSVVDTGQDVDGSADAQLKAGKDKKRKGRKNRRVLQSNLDDYAAIDIHNISLIYLKRSLLEDLIEDTDNFHDKVVGAFVRIRILGAKKQEMYRLVQIVGTSKAAEPYKVGKRMTHNLLEILNLDKTEVVSIDNLSNQEFTEDECKRLRQSIKCGLINRLTVGDIQEKAMALQAVRVKDWLEAEIVRLSHLCDRASEKGKRKELRECVEKLQLLKTPEERQRRLEEIPEIHDDPNMDPSYESEEDEAEEEEKKQETFLTPRGSAFGRRAREPISPQKGGSVTTDSWTGTRNYSSMNRELSRNMSNKGFFNKGDGAGSRGDIVNDNLWNQARDRETPSNSYEKPKTPSMVEASPRNTHHVTVPNSYFTPVADSSAASLSTSLTQSTDQVDETEKLWHYKDPSGKVQGPFSIQQLRKWNKSGYFPSGLKIWRDSETYNSILLTDVLAGKIQKEQPISHLDHNRATWSPRTSMGSSGQSVIENWRPEATSLKSIAAPSVEVPKYPTGGWGSGSDYNRSDLPNLPSPTPSQSGPGELKEQAYERKWSPTSFPVRSGGSVLVAHQESGRLAGPTPATPLRMPVPDGSSNFHGALTQHTNVLSNRVQNLTEYAGAVASPSFGVHGESQRFHSSEASLSSGAVDSKTLSANLQNLIQSVSSQVRPAVPHGWSSGLVTNPVAENTHQAWRNVPSQKLEPDSMIPSSAQSQSYGHYGAAPSSLSTGYPTGAFPASAISGVSRASDPWRPSNPLSVAAPQSNNQPSVAPNQSWVGQFPGNPNMGWAGSNNMNWGVSGPAGNTNPGWAVPGQGPAPINGNAGWAARGQGPSPGTSHPGWAGPTGNPNMWRNQQSQNQNGDRFSSQMDRGSHRQPSFNNAAGGRGGGAFKTRVCMYHESGHCKKGSACNYLHT